MVPELTFDDSYAPDRGKVYNKEQLVDMDAFYRYLDVDGDGIPWRTLPGVDETGAYFVRGSGHNKYGGYTEKSDEYQEVVDRLRRKFDTAANMVPAPAIDLVNGATGEPTKRAIISIGSCDGAVREARDQMASDKGNLDYCRLIAFPFSDAVREFIERYERVYVVEQNRDAQLRQLSLIHI